MSSSTIDTCASCGKESNSDDMNTCNKCKMVKYCNAARKKKHRKKHKKACERRVAELHEEALFKDIEPEECPICILPLPLADLTFEACCGKVICNGCIYAMEMSEEGQGELCPFCRMPTPKSNEEEINRAKKQMDKGNADAYYFLGCQYAQGEYGMPQDYQKANELYLKAGERGCSGGYYNLGQSYRVGRGVERDDNKAKHYYELASMMGSAEARHNLGSVEWNTGNHHWAYKHWILAARAGDKLSVERVKYGFTDGIVTKDEYASTLRAYQKRHDEMTSETTTKAKQ